MCSLDNELLGKSWRLREGDSESSSKLLSLSFGSMLNVLFCDVCQLPMLKSRWKLIIFGALTQYAHGLFAQFEHRLHEPRELLTDAGFQLLPVSVTGHMHT